MSIENPLSTIPAGASHRSGASSVNAVAVGDAIGRFVVLRRLGEGAMGVVYAGYDVELDRKVALKVIRTEVLSETVRERLLRAAQALAKLSHPKVVQIYEAQSISDRGAALLVLDKACRLEHHEMAGERRLGELELLRELAGGHIALPEQREDAPTRGIGERFVNLVDRNFGS